MNDPQHILVDAFGTKNAKDELTDGILFDVKTKLNLSVLNYQYGYVDELKETLAQMAKTPAFAVKKYPLVWLVQPFTIARGELGWFGTLENGRLFIIAPSEKTLKAQGRMSTVFKPVIYPIYTEILNQVVISSEFDQLDVDSLSHKITDRYYWGEEQQKVISDVFDCLEISQLKLKIHNNPNYKFFKSF